MIQKSLLATLLIVGCFGFLTSRVQAQDELRAKVMREKPKLPKHDKGAPFDGGISLLIAAGAVYTAKKAHEKRKRETANQQV